MDRQQGKRPNVIFITSDQHRADCFGFEGRRIKTPHLDMMAREGTRFSKCFVTNPHCQPSRVSMLTGLLPLTHGVVDNGFDLSDELAASNGFASILSRAGYKTGLVGKAHFMSRFTETPSGSPECQESQPAFGPEWHGPYKGFEHVELVVFGHYRSPPPPPPHGMHYERWYYADGRGEEKNRLLHQNLGEPVDEPQTWYSGLPSLWHTTQWVTDRTVEFIRENKNEPFCLWVSYPDPHVPFDCPEPWSRLHRPAEVDLPVVGTMDLSSRPWWYEVSIDPPKGGIESLGNFDKNWTQHRRRAPAEGALRKVIANYYGMLSFIDHGVGRIRSLLQDLDLKDNTVVIYTSDHGEWLGDHGLLLKGPILFDGLIRVGLIMTGPNIPTNNVVDSLVSLVDLPSTLYDLCGVTDVPKTHGLSLLDSIAGKSDRKFVLNEFNLQKSGFYASALDLRTVRTDRYRMTVEETNGGGELYDFELDPLEQVNRYDDPSYSAVRKELEEMLQARPDDMMDPLPPPDGLV